MAMKQGSKQRDYKNFNIKIVGSGGKTIGDVAELNYKEMGMDKNNPGFTSVAVSFKLKDLPDRQKIFPKDVLTANINGKIPGRNKHISELIQKLEYFGMMGDICLAPGQKREDLNKEIAERSIPDDFEVGPVYQFKGIMMIEEDEIDDKKKKYAGKSFKNRM